MALGAVALRFIAMFVRDVTTQPPSAVSPPLLDGRPVLLSPMKRTVPRPLLESRVGDRGDVGEEAMLPGEGVAVDLT